MSTSQISLKQRFNEVFNIAAHEVEDIGKNKELSIFDKLMSLLEIEKNTRENKEVLDMKITTYLKKILN